MTETEHQYLLFTLQGRRYAFDLAATRKRNEVVALEFWRVVHGQQRAMRHVVDDQPPSASALAQICAAEFRAALPRQEL